MWQNTKLIFRGSSSHLPFCLFGPYHRCVLDADDWQLMCTAGWSYRHLSCRLIKPETVADAQQLQMLLPAPLTEKMTGKKNRERRRRPDSDEGSSVKKEIRLKRNTVARVMYEAYSIDKVIWDCAVGGVVNRYSTSSNGGLGVYKYSDAVLFTRQRCRSPEQCTNE